MSDSSAEMRMVVREEFIRFWIILGWFVLVAFSTVNFVLLVFVVPRFGWIFKDALPGKPLPIITNLILAHNLVFALVMLCWPFVGLILQRQPKSYVLNWIVTGIVLFFIFGGITVLAMFEPLFEPPGGGMSDAGGR